MEKFIRNAAPWRAPPGTAGPNCSAREGDRGWRIIQHRNRADRPRRSDPPTRNPRVYAKIEFPRDGGWKGAHGQIGCCPLRSYVLFCNGEITITTVRSMASPMMFAAHFPIVSAFQPFFTIAVSLSLSRLFSQAECRARSSRRGQIACTMMNGDGRRVK